MEEPGITIGSRIEVSGDIGTVKFFGTVPSTQGKWIGVEWDEPSRGKHDGSKDGVSYFTCKHPTGGSFLRPNKVNKGITLYQAIKERYTATDDFADSGMFLASASGAVKEIESVGMDEVQKQFEKLHELKQIGLRYNFISSAGQPGVLSSLVPNIVDLEISKNLLSSWDTVCDIATQLKFLKVLNLSENILTVTENSLTRSYAFATLHTLVLNRCRLVWSQVVTCSKMWPNIIQLHLVNNDITDMSALPADVFKSLEFLNLSENSLNSWNDVRKLDSLPSLSSLFLNDCGFLEINVLSEEFKTLRHISLAGNKFETLQIFNEINKFPSVDNLTFRNNKVMEVEDYRTMQEIIVAKIRKLKIYNRSEVQKEERKSAELDYLRKYGLEWKNAGGHQDPAQNNPSQEFLRDHPRFMEIAEVFGAPEDHQLLKKTSAIKENLIEVMIEAPVKPEFRAVKKRLPLSMTVGNLKLLIQKLTKIEIRKHRLVYVSKDAMTIIPKSEALKIIALLISLANGKDDSYVVDLHRDFETLHDVSIEPLDRIQVLKPVHDFGFRLRYKAKAVRS